MLALCMLVPLIVSIAGGHWAHARNFTMGLTLTHLFPAPDYFRPTNTTPACAQYRIAGNHAFVLVVLPILASIPLTGAVQVRSFMAGYFEAVSG